MKKQAAFSPPPSSKSHTSLVITFSSPSFCHSIYLPISKAIYSNIVVSRSSLLGTYRWWGIGTLTHPSSLPFRMPTLSICESFQFGVELYSLLPSSYFTAEPHWLLCFHFLPLLGILLVLFWNNGQPQYSHHAAQGSGFSCQVACPCGPASYSHLLLSCSFLLLSCWVLYSLSLLSLRLSLLLSFMSYFGDRRPLDDPWQRLYGK